MTDNIVHFVLARPARCARGHQGISLFLIRNFMVNADGRSRAERHLSERRRAQARMHASPTCTMTMGDKGGAVGYLIGEETRACSACSR